MQTHPLNGGTAVRTPRDFLTVLSIISVVVMVTTEADAAFFAAAWGLTGLLHLPVSFQTGLYIIVAAATLAFGIWVGRRAFDSDSNAQFCETDQ